MFEKMMALYLEDIETQKANTAFYIQNGYLNKWADANKVFSDDGIRRYSTETRWNQYTEGKITRDKAVEFAVKRYNKAADKKAAETIKRVERIGAAPDLDYITLRVEWRGNSQYGKHPHAYAHTNNESTTGFAGGWGYDKESAAVADAFNKNKSIMKVLYTLKETALLNGLSDESETACTGRNNTACIGYGAGYTVIPYFEGGVGVECFWKILKAAGFTVRTNYGKHENNYNIYKA